MLFLLFQLGNDRYALDSSRVVEVLPLLDLKKIPQAPRGVAGIFNYHGQPVPTVDLSELTLGRPAGERLSTRIILMNYSGDDGKDHLLGLIAEHATEMIRRNKNDFTDAGVKLRAAPFLGPVLADDKGVVQLIHEEKLLSGNLREFVCSETLESVGNPV